MIYMRGSDIAIIVLESGNLEEIKKGRPAKTPDSRVLIAWTPDPVWLADRILDCNGDVAAIGRLIDEAAKRPEKPLPRPYHKLHEAVLKADHDLSPPERATGPAAVAETCAKIVETWIRGDDDEPLATAQEFETKDTLRIIVEELRRYAADLARVETES